MKIKAADGVARILRAEGVTWVSTFPTSGVNNAIGDAGLRLLMMRDERYAVALADALSRVTGGESIGVCTPMGGEYAAGIQMRYGALAQAFEDSSPLLCITDGVPIPALGKPHYDMTLG
jgi:thiamine pyrophosphate-dependent acetolactate synthase large subunit-like protein